MTKPAFRLVGILTISVATLGFSNFAQTKDKPTESVDHKEHMAAFQTCAKACAACQLECDMCSTHCAHQLHMGKKDHITTLLHCQDCATVCAAASQIVARGGPMASVICQACADCCSACAKECDKFTDDAHMKKCAQECMKCEKACREMLKHVVSAK